MVEIRFGFLIGRLSLRFDWSRNIERKKTFLSRQDGFEFLQVSKLTHSKLLNTLKKISEILMKFLFGFETLIQGWLDDFWLVDTFNLNDQSEIIKPVEVINKGETDLHWDIRAIFVTTRKKIIFVSLVGLSEVSIAIYLYNFPKSKKLLFCNQGWIKYWCPMWFLSSRKSLPDRNYNRWTTWRHSRNFRSTIRNGFKLVTRILVINIDFFSDHHQLGWYSGLVRIARKSSFAPWYQEN